MIDLRNNGWQTKICNGHLFMSCNNFEPTGKIFRHTNDNIFARAKRIAALPTRARATTALFCF